MRLDYKIKNNIDKYLMNTVVGVAVKRKPYLCSVKNMIHQISINSPATVHPGEVSQSIFSSCRTPESRFTVATVTRTSCPR